MATNAEIKGIVAVVLEALQEFRSGPVTAPTVSGVQESTELLRATPLGAKGPLATKIFGQWKANDPGQISLQIKAGDGQSGTPGNPVTTPPTVEVRDARGRVVADMPVRFAVSRGDGATPRARVVTDPNGIAAVPWTLGPAAGENRLVASIEGSEVTFTATATP
jgi:hypothetical protein